MSATVTQPIIIIGTHRSGTTFLGQVLDQHPDTAYWEEPRHVWVYGNTYKHDDKLTKADLTPKILRHIRKEFAKYLARSGKPRLLEKTPSNCLRLEVVHEAFPDARFVHIYRDGRAVVRSTREVNTGTPDAQWIFKRLLGMPVWEWPSLVPRAFRTFGAKFLGGKMSMWGPLPPGWREWAEHDPQHVLLAKQWRYTLEPVLEFRETLPEGQWLDMRYEDFMREPEARCREILAFCGLSESEEVLSYVRKTVDPTRKDKWRDELTDEQMADMEPVLRQTVERLGYQW